MRSRNGLFFVFLIGALGVILGALKSHYLPKYLSSNQLESIATATNYLFINIPVLLFANFLKECKLLTLATNFIFFGMLLFSGSIVLLIGLKVTNITYPKVIGLITPIGGLLIIIGWVLMAFVGLRYKKP